MGKKKLTIIDDSQPEVEVKKEKKKINPNREIIAKEAKAEETKVENQVQTRDQSKKTEPEEPKQEKKFQKQGKAKPRSKKYKEIVSDLDRSKTYPLNEAVELTKKLSYSKFTGTLEAHINTTQTGIRGLVSLPFASGRKIRIVAFGKNAQDSGADIVGTEETIEEINKGKVNFDLVITSPDWMSKLAKVARILGPRGLMPNPKNGTITDDLKKAVDSFQAGKTEYGHSPKQVYKTEAKGFVIHMALGKLDQPTEELTVNIKTLLQTLGKTRVKKVTLAPTIGPGVKVNLGSV